jgi:hypothetical protein
MDGSVSVTNAPCWQCDRCGHVWVLADEGRPPQQCPSCRQKGWNLGGTVPAAPTGLTATVTYGRKPVIHEVVKPSTVVMHSNGDDIGPGALGGRYAVTLCGTPYGRRFSLPSHQVTKDDSKVTCPKCLEGLREIEAGKESEKLKASPKPVLLCTHCLRYVEVRHGLFELHYDPRPDKDIDKACPGSFRKPVKSQKAGA